MITRTTILIKSEESNEEVRVYHHFDGDLIGRDIKAYLKTVTCWDVYSIANDLIKGCCRTLGNRPDNGYYLTPCQHGDEKFAYLIDCDKETLTCYEIGWDEFDWKDENIIEIPD